MPLVAHYQRPPFTALTLPAICGFIRTNQSSDTIDYLFLHSLPYKIEFNQFIFILFHINEINCSAEGAFKKLKPEPNSGLSSVSGGVSSPGSGISSLPQHAGHTPTTASCPTPARRRHRTTFTQVRLTHSHRVYIVDDIQLRRPLQIVMLGHGQAMAVAHVPVQKRRERPLLILFTYFKEWGGARRQKYFLISEKSLSVRVRKILWAVCWAGK